MASPATASFPYHQIGFPQYPYSNSQNNGGAPFQLSRLFDQHGSRVPYVCLVPEETLIVDAVDYHARPARLPNQWNNSSRRRNPDYERFILNQSDYVNVHPTGRLSNRTSALVLRPDDETLVLNVAAHPGRRPDQLMRSSQSNNQTAADAFLEEQRILQHLTRRNFVSDEEEGPEICIVCQDEYQENQRVGRLCCGHEYHVDCITEWLLQKNVCPICRAQAFPIH